MIKFPEDLPNPSQSYKLGITNRVMRTKMDSGRIRQRRRSTESVNAISVKWEMTDEEFQLFESFCFFSLDGANSWFEAKILTGGGIVTSVVRFQGGKYDATYQSHLHWVVTAKLDVQDINRMDKEVFDFYDELEGELSFSEIDDLVNELEIFTNYTLPNNWS